MSDAPVLVVSHLSVEAPNGASIVLDVSFELCAGEVLALVGESGCGKTTTALALLAHARDGARITGGEVRLAGEDLLQLSRRQLRSRRGALIGYVPQDPSSALDPRQRVGRQLIESMIVHGVGGSAARARASSILEDVGLGGADLDRRYPFELSGGQQQRVAIAMALACNARVIVLDEPTTGLDVTTQDRILELLRTLRRERDLALVYVTHDLAVVKALADRVAVMYAGHIVESGARDAVLFDPAHPYTTLLLGAVPSLSDHRRLVTIEGSAPAPSVRPPGCPFAPRCPIAVPECTQKLPALVEQARQRVRCLRPHELVPSPLEPYAPAQSQRRAAAMLEIQQAHASYADHEVLRGITLAVDEGECLALVGESGSGKTTLGRCVVGLHQLGHGAVTLRGDVLASRARERSLDQRRAIQIIFQNPDRSLNPNHTVVQSIGRPLRQFGFASRRTERREVAALLARVRLGSDKLDRYPRELSGGEKQRVAIARALAARPLLVVCDEVTSALDVSIQAAIVDLLDDLKRDGLSLLFITHNLALVRSVADRVAVLRNGDVCEQGEVGRILAMPAHAYTRALLAAAPDLTPPEMLA